MGNTAFSRRLEEEARRLLGGGLTHTTAAQPVLHIRWNGQSRDVSLPSIGLTGDASPQQVRNAVTSLLGEPLNGDVMLDRSPDGNWLLRPAAVFG